MRTTSISLAVLMGFCGSAFAADLPSRVAPPVFVAPPIPVFVWTGFYIGGQVGYSFGRDTGSYHPDGTAGGPYPFRHDVDGVIGGGHVGYLFSPASLPLAGALGSGLVIGVEGDVDGGHETATQDVGILDGFRPGYFVNRLTTNIQGSGRGRLGYAIGPILVYGTGGAAVASFKSRYYVNGLNYDGNSPTRLGWTAGGGVEYALTPHILVRGEYRYSDFGRFTDEDHTGFNGFLPFAQRHEIQQRAQFGVSYLFATPVAAPVVARY